MSRPEKVVWLLGSFREFLPGLEARAELAGGSGRRSGSRVHRLPLVWQSHFAAFEAVLRRMRDEQPELYWHVSERYLRSTRRQTKMKRRGNRWVGLRRNEAIVVGDPGGVRRARGFGAVGPLVELDVIVESWDPWVDARQVEAGVAWLAREAGSLWLPREVAAAA